MSGTRELRKVVQRLRHKSGVGCSGPHCWTVDRLLDAVIDVLDIADTDLEGEDHEPEYLEGNEDACESAVEAVRRAMETLVGGER